MTSHRARRAPMAKAVVAITAYDSNRGKQLNAEVCDFLANKILNNRSKIEAAKAFVKANDDCSVDIMWDESAPKIDGYSVVWWLTIEKTRQSVCSFVRMVDDDPDSECHELIGSFKIQP